MSRVFSPILHPASGAWLIGVIENHTAKPLGKDEIEVACEILNRPIAPLIAASSLGTIPIAEHTKLLNATHRLVQAADLVLDGLPRQQRQQLQRAIAAVAEAVGG